MTRLFVLLAALWFAIGSAEAGAPFRFASIDGGDIDLADWAGRPVLVVNTASRCGFTRQFDDLQALYDRFRDRGLVVLAVPSGDFRQELATNAEVAAFCAVNFDLDLPMTEITRVRGPDAHPFYRWLEQTHGFVPAWNFNKVLLDGKGRMVGTWGSATRPTSGPLVRAIEPLLK
ncbi:MAG: glutathione peroxidase [Gemmobacter sp.]